MEKKTRQPARTKNRQNSEASAFLSTEEVRALVSLRHPDPHQLLGPHLTNGGLVIRAFRPDAKEIQVTILKRAHPMQRTHDAGVFEVSIAGLSVVPTYRFRIVRHDDQAITTRD